MLGKWLVFSATAALFVPLARGAGQDVLPNIPQGTIGVSLKPIASGLVAPTYAQSMPGDPGKLLVVDQAGKIDIIQNGVVQPTPFLDVSSIEASVPLNPGYDERGLLGLAFAPGFTDQNSPGYHTLFTYQSEQTGTAPADFGPVPGTLKVTPTSTGINHQNVLVQWRIGANGLVDPSTRKDLIREDHPALNHNGGTIAFGPDGMLYLAIGDGGTANDTGNGHVDATGNAQLTSVIMGKMLRIDPFGANSANGKYGIPSDNPFLNTPGAVKEVYAYGFRNPYKFSFDPATGNLIEADVGQNTVEEVNIVTKGSNFGWPIKEGTFLFQRTGSSPGTVGANSPGAPGGLVDPIAEYDHGDGSAIVGGFVYHGSAIPQLDGKYVFGDFSNSSFAGPPNGRIFYLDMATGVINEFLDQPLNIWVKGFGEDANQELYVLGSTALGPTGTTGVVLELVAPVPEPASLAVLGLGSMLLLRRRTRQPTTICM